MPAIIITRWRPAGTACSPSATFVQPRSSASPRRSARAPRWWPRCTPTWAQPRASRLRRPALWRQLEVLEVKARRHSAAAERPIAERLRRLPGLSRHHGLRPFAVRKIAAKHHIFDASLAVRDFQLERRAGVPVPDLGGIDPMPVRALAARQQKIDRGRCGAGVLDLPHIAKHLAEMAALRMRFQIEQPDDVASGQAFVAQNRFFRSRISANTCHAGLPARPSDFATSASSARRNGLAAFSAPIVAGMVGLPAARSFLTSSARAASALLFGSTVLAKRMLASVYS